MRDVPGPQPGKWLVRAFLLASVAVAACSGPSDGGRSDGIGSSGPRATASSDAATPPSGATISCDSPAEGCPCNVAGQAESCRGPSMTNGAYVYCLIGSRLCDGQTWGPCVLPKVY